MQKIYRSWSPAAWDEFSSEAQSGRAGGEDSCLGVAGPTTVGELGGLGGFRWFRGLMSVPWVELGAEEV